MTRATAVAHPNIALVKYWGKADTELALPATGSVSMTLDVFPTTTTVSVGADGDTDRFVLNGRRITGTPFDRVRRFLDLVRTASGVRSAAVIESTNTVPTGAGLASSASGFAALAGAAASAYGLDLTERDLSRLARRGSGSATRSVPGGVAVWHAGDDTTSFAERISSPAMSMVVVTIDGAEKAVSSRSAMLRTSDTSPFYPAWVASTARTVEAMLDACRAEDFTRIGELTEANALRMHATIVGAFPPVRYLGARSVAVFDAIAALRAAGTETYATADAGPNVVALCRPSDTAAVVAALGEFGDVTVSGTGPAVHVVQEEEVA